MFSLFLSVVCSVLIAFILKINEIKSGDRLVVLGVNYIIATGVGALLWRYRESASLSLHLPVLLFAAAVGIGFVVAFFAYMKSVKTVGISLATLVARLSIVLPLLLSALFYTEIPTVIQWIGILLTLLTLVTFTRSIRQDKTKTYTTEGVLYLVIMFVVLGLNDFSMKIFREWQPGGDRGLYLLVLFGMATIFSWGLILIKQKQINPADVLRGVLLGIPNLFASYFLIEALLELPGIVVYPLMNVSIVLFTAIGGLILWREHLNRAGWLSLGIAVLAIAALSFGG